MTIVGTGTTNRRQALKGFLAGLGALVVPGLRPAELDAGDTGPAAPTRLVLLNRCRVAGFQYHEGQDIRDRIRAEMPVELRAETDNPHDSYAVAILFGGLRIGYIPMSDNRHMSRLLIAGVPLVGRVFDVRPIAPTWAALRVEVFIQLPARS